MNEENMQKDIKEKAGNGKKKRGAAFYFKVALVFILLIGLSIGISLYYVYHRLTRDDKFEQMLMTRISEAINMDVKFAKLEFAFPGFTIKSATLATDSKELMIDASIETIEVSPNLWAIFKGQLVLDSLSISSATALIERKMERPVVAAQQSASQAPALKLEEIVFPFNNVSAGNLTLNYKAPGSKRTQSFVLKKASLQKSMLSSALPFNIEMHSEDYCNLLVSGNLYWPDTLNASIKISSVNRETLLELVPQEHKSRLKMVQNPEIQADIIYKLQNGSLKVSSAILSAEPGFSLSGEAQFATTSPLTGSASLMLKPLDGKIVMELAKEYIPKDLGFALEQGMISGELHVSLKNSAVSGFAVKIMPSSLKARMAMLPEPVTLDKAVINYDGANITLADTTVALADSKLAIKNSQISLSPVGFNGDVSATINFNKTWKLIERFIPEDARRVVPQGVASFNGSASYKKAALSVNGTLSSDRLHIQEVTTAAFAELSNVNLVFSDLGLSSGKVDFKSLHLKGAGGSVAISGTVINAADPKFAMQARGKIQLADFSALAASLFKLPVKKEQFAGEMSVELYLGGNWSALEPSGSVKLTQVKADLSEQGLLIKDLNGEAVADKNQLNVKDLRARVVNGNLQLSGVLKNFKQPEVTAEGSLKGADLQLVRDFIKRNFPAMPEELRVGGQADLKIKIAGAIAAPKVDGSATLKNASFFHSAVLREVQAINGPVTFNNKGLASTGIKATWGSSHAVVKGQLNDWGKLVSDFTYSVDPLDATDAAGFFLKDTGYELQGKGTGQGTISGALEKIKVAGVAKLPSGTFSAPISEGSSEKFRFPFTDLTADFNYHEGVFTLSPAQTNIFAGRVIVNGKIFVSQEPIGYEFDAELQQIETAEFLKTNTKMAGALRGGVDGKGSIKGNTSGLDSINGMASLLMKKGAYQSPAVVKKIAEQLNAMHLASGTIDNLSGDYSIAAGKISSKNTMATSKAGKMKYVGTIGLDASLNGTMYLEIARNACQSSGILKQLVGNDEFLSVPVSLKGTVTSPSVGMPLDRMLKDTAGKRLKKGIEDKAKEALGNLFGGNKKKESAPEGQNSTDSTATQQSEKSEPQKIEKQLKDVGKNLKKIFKF